MKTNNVFDHNKDGIAGPLWIIATLFSVFLIFTSLDNITSRAGWGPDDQLRMVQIRDFLNGQSWFDWTQYRMNVPDGAPMHWSRLTELPIAFLIIIFKPILGQDGAEMLAGTLIPLCGLILTSYMIANVALTIWNRQAAIFAMILIWINPAIIFQFRPMRIDHHGWQIMLASLALWSMFWPSKKRGGIALGAALATWLHISLEGLPITAAFFIILGWRWIIEKTHGQRLIWTITSFSIVTITLYIATQGLPIGAQIHCDSISPPYLLAIGAAAIIMLIAINRTPQHRLTRLSLAVLAGAVALGLLILTAPQCGGGAFSQMDPLVYKYWYIHVGEGLPIWDQKLAAILFVTSVPVIGIIALFLLTPKLPVSERSKLYLVGFFAIYGAILSCFVFRTIAVASAFAIPLIAILLAQIFHEYRRSPIAAKRIGYVAAMLAIALAGPLITPLASFFTPAPINNHSSETVDDDNENRVICETAEGLAPLLALPTPSNILAPFTLSTLILLSSDHHVLASSHHRNEGAMHDQIAAMIAHPDDALKIMQKRNIEYIVTCPKSHSLDIYQADHNGSLADRILGDDVPDWMVPIPNTGALMIWRVAPAS